MVLTERDTRLLLKLQSYAILTTRQMAWMVFPGVAITTVLRRLRALERNGYIQRIEGLPSTERAWGISTKSAAMHPDQVSKVHFPKHSLDHDLKLTALRLLLEREKLALSWIPEHEIRTKIARAHGLREAQRKVIPDGIVGVKTKGVKESISIELELNFKNSRRYSQIFHDYRRKTNLYAVWYVVGSESIGRHLAKCFRQCYFTARQPYLFWSVLQDVMHDPFAATLWHENKEYFVSQIFEKKTNEPAHPPAQEVSRVNNDSITENSNSTAEYNSEKLALAK